MRRVLKSGDVRVVKGCGSRALNAMACAARNQSWCATVLPASPACCPHLAAAMTSAYRSPAAGLSSTASGRLSATRRRPRASWLALTSPVEDSLYRYSIIALCVCPARPLPPLWGGSLNDLTIANASAGLGAIVRYTHGPPRHAWEDASHRPSTLRATPTCARPRLCPLRLPPSRGFSMDVSAHPPLVWPVAAAARPPNPRPAALQGRRSPCQQCDHGIRMGWVVHGRHQRLGDVNAYANSAHATVCHYVSHKVQRRNAVRANRAACDVPCVTQGLKGGCAPARKRLALPRSNKNSGYCIC